MKSATFKSFIIVSLLSSSLVAGGLVEIEEYDPNSKLLGLPELPSGTCEKNGIKSTCNLTVDTKVKWGAGWCRKTKEELDQLIPSVNVKLYINGNKLPDDIIHKQYETYPKGKSPYCYTWLVQLYNWKPGASISLVSKNGEEILYEAIINVVPNGT